MSQKNNNNDFFSNQHTRVRRTWIESALNGAHAHLGADLGRIQFYDRENNRVTVIDQSADAPELSAHGRDATGLYLAWSAD